MKASARGTKQQPASSERPTDIERLVDISNEAIDFCLMLSVPAITERLVVKQQITRVGAKLVLPLTICVLIRKL